MRKFAPFVIAAVLMCARPAVAQEETPPSVEPAAPAAAAPDSFMQQIGDEMDRRATEAAETSEPRDRPGERAMASNYTQGILALSFVVALILVVYWAVRRWGKSMPILAGSHLGKVLGRVYLDRGTALHFVQVGEKVLLVGVNVNSVSLLGEFSSSAFNAQAGAPVAGAVAAASVPFNPDSFLAELRTRSTQFSAERTPRGADEDEIASLRGDIQRLQRYLREENREHED